MTFSYLENCKLTSGNEYLTNPEICLPAPVEPVVEVQRDPCFPSPCGPNSQCQNIGGTPSCSCLREYIGSPPNCRPECTIHPDCPSNKACINERCRDPCAGSCGLNAICSVFNHIPVCTCTEGYTGDPFSNCYYKPSKTKTSPPNVNYDNYDCPSKLSLHNMYHIVPADVEVDKCNPSPCGPNAECNDGICTCLPEYYGDPYNGCRPECVLNTDCPSNKACVRNKCIDPCPGTCGQNALCNVINHTPMCSCPAGTSGNALIICQTVTGTNKFEIRNKWNSSEIRIEK